MSLALWDRKLKLLRQDILGLYAAAAQKKQAPQEEWAKKIKKIGKLQSELEKNLAYIHSLSGKDYFLTTQEKSLLHWAKDFTNKTHQISRNYLTMLNQLLWAKLVQSRSMSLTHKRSSFSFKQASYQSLMSAYQKQMLSSKSELEGQLSNLQKKKRELFQRYDYLTIIYANRHSVDNQQSSYQKFLQVSQKLLLQQNELRQRKSLRAANLAIKVLSENAKITQLTAPYSRLTVNPFINYKLSQTKSKVPQSPSYLQKFDYLNLEAELES